MEQPLTVRLELANPKAAIALETINRLANEIAKEQPWNEDARAIVKQVRKLRRNLDIVVE